MDERKTGSGVRAGLLGTLIGGAAGFVTGLILAPESGARTRRRLAYQLEKTAMRVGNFVENVLRPQAESEARRAGAELVEDAKTRAKKIGEDIDALIGEMRTRQSTTN